MLCLENIDSRYNRLIVLGQASGSLAASGMKQQQPTAIGAAGGSGGGGGGGAAGGGATTPVSDADADLQARLDNLRRE